MNTTTHDDYLITNPVGHRIHEIHQADQYAAHLLATSGDELIIATGGADEWFCDICDQPIAPETPITSIANYALCPKCTTSHYSFQQIALLPICPCPPCTNTPRTTTPQTHEPLPAEPDRYAVGDIVIYFGSLADTFGPDHHFRISNVYELETGTTWRDRWRYIVAVFYGDEPRGHLRDVHHDSIRPA
jgi:rubredoxin